MHLVDEQDEVAVVLHFLDDALETIFELAAVLGSGDERGDIKCHEALVAQHVGHVPICDELGQALGDSRLANAGLADEQRVVLRATRENLLDAIDLALAPDDRVEPVLRGELGEVSAEFVERGTLVRASGLLCAHRCIRHGSGCAVDELGDSLANLIALDADVREDLHGNAIALANDAKQKMLGRDVVLPELQRLAKRALEHALGTRRERNMAGSGGGILIGDVLYLADDLVIGDIELLQGTRGDAFALADQAQEQVLGAHIGLLQLTCLLLCENKDTSGLVGKLFKHTRKPPRKESSGLPSIDMQSRIAMTRR